MRNRNISTLETGLVEEIDAVEVAGIIENVLHRGMACKTETMPISLARSFITSVGR